MIDILPLLYGLSCSNHKEIIIIPSKERRNFESKFLIVTKSIGVWVVGWCVVTTGWRAAWWYPMAKVAVEQCFQWVKVVVSWVGKKVIFVFYFILFCFNYLFVFFKKKIGSIVAISSLFFFSSFSLYLSRRVYLSFFNF